jgi:hypothetical protein
MTTKNPLMSIRVPEALRTWLRSEAKKNLRPVNSEIVIAISERKAALERQSVSAKK